GNFRAEFPLPGFPGQAREVRSLLAVAALHGLIDRLRGDALAFELVTNAGRSERPSRAAGDEVGAKTGVIELAGLLEVDEHGLDGVLEIAAFLEFGAQFSRGMVTSRQQCDGVRVRMVRVADFLFAECWLAT